MLPALLLEASHSLEDLHYPTAQLDDHVGTICTAGTRLCINLTFCFQVCFGCCSCSHSCMCWCSCSCFVAGTSVCAVVRCRALPSSAVFGASVGASTIWKKHTRFLEMTLLCFFRDDFLLNQTMMSQRPEEARLMRRHWLTCGSEVKKCVCTQLGHRFLSQKTRSNIDVICILRHVRMRPTHQNKAPCVLPLQARKTTHELHTKLRTWCHHTVILCRFANNQHCKRHTSCLKMVPNLRE